MSYQIKLEDLRGWMQENRLVLLTNSIEGDKQLYATLGGGFEIHHKGKMVYHVGSRITVVKKYNSL